MAEDRFHIAAEDGNMHKLRQTTKRDCNKQDDVGITPTLIAARKGNMEALRLLVSRGGEPDICDNQGYSALHFAAMNGEIGVVTFLVSFGCNIWALTNDQRNALQLAKENEHHQIADMLDEVYNEQAAKNQSEVLRKRKSAMKDVDMRNKRIEKQWKKTLKKEKKENKKYSIQPADENDQTRKSSSAVPPPGKPSRKNSGYPQLIGTVGRNNKHTRGRNTNISYGPASELYTDPTTKEPPTAAVQQRTGTGFKSNTFKNTALGLMAFSDMKVSGANAENDGDELLDGYETTFGKRPSEALNNAASTYPGGLETEFVDEVGDEISTPLELFLAVNDLSDYLMVFVDEDIDLKSLMMLTEKDIAEQLRLGLGPRKKILEAMKNRERALAIKKAMTDTSV